MNREYLTMSLPAKPQPKTNIGMLIAPILMELIGNKINSKKLLTLNTLHTYLEENDNKDVYMKDIKNINIDFDEFYNDSEKTEELLSVLKEMVNRNIIIEKKKPIYSCKCGMVDFIKDGLCYGNGKLYSERDGKLYCNNCNTELVLEDKPVLVLPYTKRNEQVNVIPSFLSKEMAYFQNLFDGNDILISKQRKTGQEIKINNMIYNIDIEFVWSQLYGINDNNKIMIASNHQVYVMFMMNLLNRYYMGKDIIFVLSPYMDSKTKFEDFERRIIECRPMVKKLLLIYSLNWKKKTCPWNFGLYKNLNKLTDDELEEMYKYISRPLEYDDKTDLIEKLSNFFNKELRFEEDYKYLKEKTHN